MIHIYKNTSDLAEAAAKHIVSLIRSVLAEKPVFTISLSGGSTPKLLFSLLSKEPYSSQIDWTRILVFWGDERFVPFDDVENNANMAYDTLLSKVPVPSENIFRMNTSIDHEAAEKQYTETLQSIFKIEESFDLALLGMGPDGHTLSIFPGEEFDNTKWVNALYVKSKQTWRITLMPSFVNMSKEVIFLVSGKEKAEVLKHVIEDSDQSFPAQLIRPVNGEVHWFVDEAAASLLSE